MGEPTADGLLPRALVVSALLHATLVGGLLRARSGDVVVRPPRLFAVSLVGRPGGGDGGGASPAPMTAEPAGPPPPPPTETRIAARAPVPSTPRPPRRTRPQPTAAPVPSDTPATGAADVASLGPGGTGSAEGGTGTGTGTNGGGTGGNGGGDTARPAYGSNPKPVYPLVAKRLRIEGVVQLEAVVKPDGLPAAVRVVASSGQPSLDESALSTVRSRWRFIPARQGDTPIESSVVFSIRFELDDG